MYNYCTSKVYLVDIRCGWMPCTIMSCNFGKIEAWRVVRLAIGAGFYVLPKWDSSDAMVAVQLIDE